MDLAGDLAETIVVMEPLYLLIDVLARLYAVNRLLDGDEDPVFGPNAECIH